MNADEQDPPHSGRTYRARVLLLVGMAALAAAITWSLPPQPQWEAYHDFADKRAVRGVPNFLDVVSNAPFAVVGAAGLWWLIRDAAARRRGRLGWQDRCAFGAMFAGVLLIALGWYTVAKLLEILDARIFSLGGIVSGHTLKHLAAAMGTYWVLRTIASNAARPIGP